MLKKSFILCIPASLREIVFCSPAGTLWSLRKPLDIFLGLSCFLCPCAILRLFLLPFFPPAEAQGPLRKPIYIFLFSLPLRLGGSARNAFSFLFPRRGAEIAEKTPKWLIALRTKTPPIRPNEPNRPNEPDRPKGPDRPEGPNKRSLEGNLKTPVERKSGRPVAVRIIVLFIETIFNTGEQCKAI